ncbi:MAG: thioredoxin domain-containing protein [Acidimicrobiia bacterium]
MNRLADESSPYLRQHRDNPVDWYPWGDEAFTAARDRDRPILLSVGYSACHWCHVMAHECFEDDDVALAMNSTFVNVKVDREERPDVDAIYMDAVQAITGRGGWPMTVFLTPDGRPFYGGTYFPKASFLQLMEAVTDAWDNRRDELLGQADQLTEQLNRFAGLTAGEEVPGVDVLNVALTQLVEQFDPEWGGFGGAPKFPQTMSLDLVLRAFQATGNEAAVQLVTTTLDAMSSGGMYDHLGGGYARYSTDAFWMVPHFEKMLYDQALIGRTLLHAWQITAEERYRMVLTETIDYVRRELEQPEGGWSSAEDADSEGEEGKFYVWRPEELVAALGEHDAALLSEWYGVTPQGNFEGSNILHRPVRGDLLRTPEIEAARRKLFDERARRVRPGLDDKVLTEWNALMCATLAEAGAALREQSWIDAATRNAEFLVATLRREDGRWLRSWQRDGGARTLAFAVDYAALIDAFTRLAEATGEARWIHEASATADALLDLFWDPEQGAFFNTGHDADPLVVRPKDLLDNATPSANSAAAVALLRLAAITGEIRYSNHVDQILMLLAGMATQHPGAFSNFLAAVDMRRAGITEIAVAGDRRDLVDAVHSLFLPNAVIVWGERFDSPLWEGRTDGNAYVCRDYTCLAPATDVESLLAHITGG